MKSSAQHNCLVVVMHHAPRSDVDRDAKVVRGACGENEKRFRTVCMFVKLVMQQPVS